MVSGTISLPLWGTFHLSLTVLVHYRSPLVSSLAGWSPRIQSGFHVSGSTQEPNLGSRPSFAYRTITFYGWAFLRHSATRAICNSPAALRRDLDSALQPRPRNARRLPRESVWAVPRSLATTKGIETFFPFLRVLRCIISPGSLLAPYVFRCG
jgi:hypothetical protein